MRSKQKGTEVRASHGKEAASSTASPTAGRTSIGGVVLPHVSLPRWQGRLAAFAFAGVAAFLVGLLSLITKGPDAAMLTVGRWFATATNFVGAGGFSLGFVFFTVTILVSLVAAFVIKTVQPRLSAAFGAGLMAVLLLAVPVDQVGALQATGPSGGTSNLLARAQQRSGEFEPTPVSVDVDTIGGQSESQPPARTQGYALTITLDFAVPPDSLLLASPGARRLSGRIYVPETGDVYDLFRSVGSDVRAVGNQLIVRARLPGDVPTADIIARIEADGFRITESRYEAVLGINKPWTIRLAETDAPLFLQRLKRVYWF